MMKIKKYENRFHLKERFCSKDGHQYLIKPLSVATQIGTDMKLKRNCDDRIRNRLRIITEQVSDFSQEEENIELVCPECHSCETCGSVYALQDRQKKLLDYCSSCGMFWCCENEVDWQELEEGEKHPNSTHQECFECEQIHCLRSVDKDIVSAEWEQCGSCMQHCCLECTKKNEETKKTKDPGPVCTYAKDFDVEGTFYCSGCHESIFRDDTWTCTGCSREICGCDEGEWYRSSHLCAECVNNEDFCYECENTNDTIFCHDFNRYRCRCGCHYEPEENYICCKDCWER